MTISTICRIEFYGISLLTLLCFYRGVERTYNNDTSLVFRKINVLEIAVQQYGFNFWTNHFLPIAALCFVPYLCWLLLHFYVVPKWFENKNKAKTIGSLLLIMSMLILGIWLYLSLYLHIDFRYCYDPTDNYREAIGAKVLPIFRKLSWFRITFFLALMLAIYEFLSKQFYKYYEELKTTPNTETKMYVEIYLVSWVVFVLHICWLLTKWLSLAFYSYTDYYTYIDPFPYIDLHGTIFFGFVFVLHSWAFHQIILKSKDERKIKEWFGIFFTGIAVLVLLQIIGVIGFIDVAIFFVIPIIGFGTALVRYFILKPQVILTKKLSQKQAELASLKEQINPHFLFNAMNTLYATALTEKAENTSKGIQQLGDMMRFMMHENNQEQIDIRNEVQYLKNYIDLQRLRLVESEKLDIKVELDDLLCLHSIAPMLLVPFVENAFKHGISLRNSSWIHVKLYCQNGRLHFSVFNSIHQLQDNDPEKYSSGIGLVNVQKRLLLLYPNQHNLQIHKTEKEFSIVLEIGFSR